MASCSALQADAPQSTTDSSSGPCTEPLPHKRKDGFAYTAGPALVSGASQSILFNPIDRALYVRVKRRRRRFLDKRNFERPFQGFMNAAVYRTLVGASYMFWQDSMRIAIERTAPSWCQANVAPQLNSMMIGLSAGSVNGFALNTLQAVKFRMWNTDERGITFLRTALNMYKEGGAAIFFRGCITTMVRDSVFGVVYETTRRAAAWRLFFEQQVSLLSSLYSGQKPAALAPPELPVVAHAATVQPERFGLAAFLSNLMAALTASMLSSPFNYVRSIVYGTPPGAIPLGYMPLLKSFYTQFYYIYRHGRSYTDRHGVPELSETEHRSPPRATSATAAAPAGMSAIPRPTNGSGAAAASPAATTAAPSAAGSPTRARIGHAGSGSHVHQSNGGSGVAAVSRDRAFSWASVRSSMGLHCHHPIAAWTWANSRLNIGWGSIRVGLGMAMGQSLFYLAQDFARENHHRA